MSVKKLLVLTAAGIASLGVTAALAGGPDVAPADNGAYVDLNLGYGFQDWQGIANLIITPTRSRVWGDNSTGGFAGSVDLGYQWNQYLAAEFGYWYLPQASYTNTPAGGVAVGGNVSNYALYLAAKFMAPVMDNLDLFFKAGLAYRYANQTTAAGPLNAPANNTQTNITPTFSGGIQYNYTPNWRFNVMYTYISSNAGAPTPNVHLITAGVGYLFTL